MTTKRKHRYNKDEESKRLSPYAVFHLANIGYYWKHKLTSKIIDKRVMFEMYGNNSDILYKLTINEHQDYSREVKSGF